MAPLGALHAPPRPGTPALPCPALPSPPPLALAVLSPPPVSRTHPSGLVGASSRTSRAQRACSAPAAALRLTAPRRATPRHAVPRPATRRLAPTSASSASRVTAVDAHWASGGAEAFPCCVPLASGPAPSSQLKHATRASRHNRNQSSLSRYARPRASLKTTVSFEAISKAIHHKAWYIPHEIEVKFRVSVLGLRCKRIIRARG